VSHDVGAQVLICKRWSPDTAAIKNKMLYASSKDAIKLAFNGIGVEIQGTDYAEVAYESVLEKVSRGRA
jgi:cofilin